MAKNNNHHSNTDLCVDIKTNLVRDRVAKLGKYYVGSLHRDTEDHYTFTESARCTGTKRTPQLFNGKYITITCGENGSLRLNLKAVFLSQDFSCDEFVEGLSVELQKAVSSLIEKEDSEI